jgi:hypothetical protein
MIFSPVNLKDELANISKADSNSDKLLADVNQWLSQQAVADDKALANFPNNTGVNFDSTISGLQFDVNQVYTREQIKELCIRFRLRFLPSEMYKGTLPYAAITAITDFEYTFTLGDKKQYYIVAPAEFFKLHDRFSDPLLFAKLSNGTYYLLHQWGDDFKPYKQAIVYPMRNEKTLAITSVGIGVLVTLLFLLGGVFSLDKYNTGSWFAMHVITFIFSASFTFVTSVVYGLVTYSDLSEDTWNSKYFN